MTTLNATFRENASRCPAVPCHLTPPLKEVHYERQGFVPHLPVVGSGTVFLTLKTGRTAALDERTFRKRWVTSTPASPVALGDGRLLSCEEEMTVLAPVSGAVLGRIAERGSLSAAEYEGVVVAFTFEGRGILYCASPASNSILWRIEDRQGDGEANRFVGVCGTRDDRVIVGREDRTVMALRLADGKELWRTDVTIIDPATHKPSGEVQGAIVIGNDRTLVEVWPWGACALSLESGAVLWRWVGHVPVQAYLYDDRYYILGQAGQFFVLDPDTGKVLQRSRLGEQLPPKARKEVGTICDPMLVSESHLWVGSETGHVVAFERDGLGYAWHGRPKKAASTHFQGSAFISVNGRLYYGDQTFGIHCLEEVNPTDPQLAAWRAEDEAKKKGWFRR